MLTLGDDVDRHRRCDGAQTHTHGRQILPGQRTGKDNVKARCAAAADADIRPGNAIKCGQRGLNAVNQRGITGGCVQRKALGLSLPAQNHLAYAAANYQAQLGVGRHRIEGDRILCRATGNALHHAGIHSRSLRLKRQRREILTGKRATKDDGKAELLGATHLDLSADICLRPAAGDQQVFKLAAHLVANRLGSALTSQCKRRTGTAKTEQQRTDHQIGVQTQHGVELERGLCDRVARRAEVAVDGQRQRLGGHRQTINADKGRRTHRALQGHPFARFVGTVAHQGERKIGVLQIKARRARAAAIDAGKGRDRLRSYGQQVYPDLVAIGQQNIGNRTLKGKRAGNRKEPGHLQRQITSGPDKLTQLCRESNRDAFTHTGKHGQRVAGKVDQRTIGGSRVQLEQQQAGFQRDLGYAQQGHRRGCATRRHPVALPLTFADQGEGKIELQHLQPHAFGAATNPGKAAQVGAPQCQHIG